MLDFENMLLWGMLMFWPCIGLALLIARVCQQLGMEGSKALSAGQAVGVMVISSTMYLALTGVI